MSRKKMHLVSFLAASCVLTTSLSRSAEAFAPQHQRQQQQRQQQPQLQRFQAIITHTPPAISPLALNLFHSNNSNSNNNNKNNISIFGNIVNNNKKKKLSSPLEDEPWKNEDSYWDMLQQASKDPETFEKFIEESVAKKKKLSSTALGASSSSSAFATTSAAGAGEEEGQPVKKKKGTYQRIEEWDAQRQTKNGGEGMTEDEKLQWECQRMGNQFRQNEILRHNLKSF